MVHSLTPSSPTLAAFSTRAAEKKNPLPCSGLQRNWTNHRSLEQAVDVKLSSRFIADRRTFMWGLTGALLGSIVDTESASAAKRRPPPPPPTEKKDPNVSGVQAKVIASIKRKEALKEAVAKLREEGKPIN